MRATVAAIVVIGTLAAAPSAHAGFGPGSSEPAGAQPSAVVTGDFDNDGVDDQAIANKGSNDVTILLSDGSGGFDSSSQALSSGLAPAGLAVGDLDNNGRLDLVTANEGTDDVSILLGDGAGGFTDVNTEEAGTDPAAVAIADLDDNGKADLAIANRGSEDVTILLGDGGGGFDASPSGPEALDPGAAPSGLVTADLNGDAERDFAVADAGGDVVSLFLGMASGDFFKAGDFAVGTDPAGLAAGDFDRDGLDDIAVANAGSDDITILTDDGFGGFTATASSPVALDDGAEPAALVAEDFDLDGRPDLAVANAGTDDVTLLGGDGSGGFAEDPESPFDAGGAPSGVAAGDFDRDRRLDLGVANSDSAPDDVTVLLNDLGAAPSTRFHPAAGSPEAAGDAPADIAFGDFNEDGEVDQAVASGGASSVAILLGDGAGGFSATTASPVTMHGTAAGSVAVGDLNEDGHLDLVATNNGPWGIGRLLGDGSGNFTYNSTALAAGAGWETADNALVETDHDGNLDIVTAIPSEDFIDQMFGNGAGSLSSSTVIGTGVGTGPTSLAFGNFNNDGDPDAVVLKSLSGGLEILRGFAGCCFLTSSEAAPSPGAPAVGDFDEDGDDDIAVADTTAGEMTLLLSDGGSNVDFDVAPGSGFEIGPSAGAPAVADLNSDGDLDLAVANPATDQVAVFLGDGDGGFTDSPKGPYDVGDDPAFVAAADLDGDARTDLAVANEGSDDVTVLLAGRNDLSVATIGDGSGYLDSSPAGIDCASDNPAHADCRQEYADDQVVDITAHPGPDSDFHGFPGSGCSGSGPTCTVTMDRARTVTGDFRLKVYDLETSTTGSGVGEIQVSPAGDDCGPSPPGATCDTYEFGTSVTLTADPLEESSNFTGWGGDCASFGSAETCTVTIDGPKSVTAEYTLKQRRLDVTTSGTGSGIVLSTPAGIDCGSGGHTDCDETSHHGDQITLSAQEDFATSEFKGWSDPSCPDNVQSCVVTYDAAKTVDAQFDLKPRALTVTTSGTGVGYVDSVPAGIDCGRNSPTHSDCDESQPHGTTVTLTAHPAANTNFTGWDGAGCSGSAETCEITLDAAKAVNAEFTLKQRSLDVSAVGTGSGFVDSLPAGIDCGVPPTGQNDCDDSYADGTAVTLTAHPDGATTDFTGFAGAGCTTSPCTVTMDAAKSVTATFTLKPRTLTLTTLGTGSGFVDAAPGGVDCGRNAPTHTDCSESYPHGTSVTLTLHPVSGTDASFTGSGCKNAGLSCTLTMNQARTVQARFAADLQTNFTPALSGPEPTEPAPSSISLADFDGDGHLDQAVVDQVTGNLVTLLGAGDGSFEPAATSPEVVDERAIQSEVADLDGAGGPDLVVATQSPGVKSFINEGGGDFSVGEVTNFTQGFPANAIATGDLNSDGEQDVVASTINSRVLVLLGDGDGGFVQQGSGTTIASPGTALAIGDFEADGDEDVAVVRRAQNSVSILTNAGNGSLSQTSTRPVGGDPREIVGADFDGDGNSDLAVSNQGSNNVSILLANGSGGFTDASPEAAPAATALAVGDVDNDFKLDLVVTDVNNARVTILLGDGGGQFSASASSPEAVEGANPSSIAAGDLNEDGRADLAVAMEGAGQVVSLLGDAHRLDVTAVGTGAGHVDSSIAGIDCGRNSPGHSECGLEYPPGTEVTLTAHPNTGTDFAGWSGGGCSGTATTCSLTMDQARTVNATFTIQRHELTLTAGGTMAGAVFSNPVGVTCGHDMGSVPGIDFTDCAETYDHGTMVVLSAGGDPETTSGSLTGGGCNGGDTCFVTMDQARSVTATFTLTPRTLTVNRQGTGRGTITGPGIDCGPGAGQNDCSETVLHGDTIELTATPAVNADFKGFTGGGCSASPCTVTMNADKPVAGTFDLKPRTLEVTRSGSGDGTITGPGIDCGPGASQGDCSETVPDGQAIELTASGDSHSDFAGFSGSGCSTSPCTVMMDAGKAVSASFSAKPLSTLTVSKSGSGSGSVSSIRAGISCGSGCSAEFERDEVVELSARPDAGSSFAGFTGAGCAGGGTTCRIVVGTDPIAVQAAFNDTGAPNTEITRVKRNSGKRTATVTFEATEPGSTFKCSLDGKKPKPCESPATYKKLDPGKTTFEVAATDAAGNTDPTPAKTKIKLPSRKRSR